MRGAARAAAVAVALGLGGGLPGAAGADTIRVDVTPSHATNQFRPAYALGAGIDRMSAAATD
ncbi:MAG: hypothetical protein QOI66_1150, partial [Myxococcales bacterium]|nr:hypothetical protein [Myxococcales bacterium]